MDTLFRLKMSDIKANNYFANELPSDNNNYFYAKSKINDLESGDVIYFSCNGYIKAKAIFSGKTDLNNTKRHPDKNGYKHY